jgi:CheY-like chemotaxis protein
MPANHKPLKSAETILVVNDEVLIRLAISEYLRDCGYRVVEAANADEAIVVLQHIQLQVDIVFTDIAMPGSMDGFGLSQWIRANRPGLDVILAGTVPRAVDVASHLCDRNETVPKPYDPQVVLDRIRRLMGSRAARKPPEMSRERWGRARSASVG